MDISQAKKHKLRFVIINVLVHLVLIPPILVAIILCLPIVGNIVVLSLANDLGCTVNASGTHPCYFLGQDIGGIVYNYAIASLLGGVINPFLFLGILLDLPAMVVPLWVVLVALLFVARANAKSRCALANNLFKPNPLRGSA